MACPVFRDAMPCRCPRLRLPPGPRRSTREYLWDVAWRKYLRPPGKHTCSKAAVLLFEFFPISVKLHGRSTGTCRDAAGLELLASNLSICTSTTKKYSP